MGNSPSAEAEKSKAVEGAATSTPASRPKDGGAQDAATVVDPTMLPVSNLPANLQFKFGVEILDDLNTAALLVADTVGLYLLGSAEPCFVLEYSDIRQWTMDGEADTISISFLREGRDQEASELTLSCKNPSRVSDALAATMKKLFPTAVIQGGDGTPAQAPPPSDHLEDETTGGAGPASPAEVEIEVLRFEVDIVPNVSDCNRALTISPGEPLTLIVSMMGVSLSFPGSPAEIWATSLSDIRTWQHDGKDPLKPTEFLMSVFWLDSLVRFRFRTKQAREISSSLSMFVAETLVLHQLGLWPVAARTPGGRSALSPASPVGSEVVAGDGSPRADEGQDDGPTGEDDAPADDSEGPAAVEPPGPDGDVPAASVPTVGDEAEVPVPVDADAVVQAEADEEPIEESEAAGSAK